MNKKTLMFVGTIWGLVFQNTYIAHAAENMSGSGAGLKDAISLIARFAAISGGLWLVWSMIIFAGLFKDKMTGRYKE